MRDTHKSELSKRYGCERSRQLLKRHPLQADRIARLAIERGSWPLRLKRNVTGGKPHE